MLMNVLLTHTPVTVRLCVITLMVDLNVTASVDTKEMALFVRVSIGNSC